MSTALATTHTRAVARPKAGHPMKRPPARARNAGPRRPAAAKEPVAAKLAPPTRADNFRHWWQNVLGSLSASAIGALSVRWGIAPRAVLASLGGAGTLGSIFSSGELLRNAATGVSSAVGSQVVLHQIEPAPAPAPSPAPPPTPTLALAPAPSPAPPRVKNADLGQLPPGMLDAAFERARAELAATSGDGYPEGYDPHGFVPMHVG